MKKNSRNKAPAFQFYAADWLTDTSLRLVSCETRGVWIDLLCHAFLSSDPGFLIVGGQVLDESGIRKLSGLTPKKFKKVFNELTDFGILKRDEFGRYYSKRMVEDARLSRIRREAGSKGGNPNLIKKVPDLVNQNDNQNQTLSSSSSSSTSIQKKKKKKEVIVIDHVFDRYVKENCPRIASLKTQLTLTNCENLEATFGKKDVIEIFDQMENFKKLNTNYSSVYLTAKNWLKKRKEHERNSKDGRKPSFEEKLRDF
jgi:hypothetical protein|tara:strand:- start:382 stop:1149 length:768 start_codon:yes stop_codon:yes gene_type:complete